MPAAPARPVARHLRHTLIFGTALAFAVPLAGLPLAATAATVPPSASVVTGIGEVMRPSIYTQNDAGTWLQGGAVDPSRDLLYLADTTKDDRAGLSVLDLTTGAASMVPLAGPEYALDAAVSPIDGSVYVVHNATQGIVSVVEPGRAYSSTELPPTVAVGENPQKVEVGADGRAYVTNLNDDSVSVLGRADGVDRLNVVQTITGVNASGATSAIDNERNLLFIASENAKTITVIDTAAVPATVRGSFAVAAAPTGVGVDPRTGAVVIVSTDDGAMSWFSSTDGWTSAQVVRSEQLGSVPATRLLPLSVDVRADGTAFAVTQVFPFTSKSFVSVVPPVVTEESPVRTISTGAISFWGVLDPQQGGSLYVPNAGNGNVSVVSEVALSTTGSTGAFGEESRADVTATRADGYPLSASVTVTDSESAVLGTGSLDGSGTAAVSFGTRPVGETPFTTTITTPTGFSLSATGTSTTSQALTTTTATLPGGTLTEGDSATVTVQVAAAHGTVPTGTVTLSNGSTVLGTATLQDGSGVVTISGLTAGESQLTASYDGDESHVGSTSAPVTLTVQARTAQSELAQSTGSVGGTMSIAVSGFAPHEVVKFTMYSEPIELGEIRVDARGAGTFTFTIPQVEAGTHTIVAVGETSGRSSSSQIVIAGAATAPGSAGGDALANTGADAPTDAVIAAVLMLMLGASLVMWRRARHSAQAR